ncbi:MAG: hypothetical protein CMF50_10490 [Legionellales bacterium]|nr:hypothetical protein [Legionellales bacterium]|tara:strand:- start:20904 stop:21530 length:627 start_codon:yes stop_codon:yes gene_type:complete
MNKPFVTAAVAVSALFLSSSSYAFFFSSSTANCYMNVGDSMTTIEQACGAPTSKEQKETGGPSSSIVQYWSYDNTVREGNLAPRVNQNPDQISGQRGRFNQSETYTIAKQGPNLIFAIDGQTIKSITKNGKKVSRASCQSSSVQVGQGMQDLLSACGNPSNKNIGHKSTDKPEETLTVWKYDLGQFRNPVVLTFGPDGKLRNINADGQ